MSADPSAPPDPGSRIPNPLYACVYQPSVPDLAARGASPAPLGLPAAGAGNPGNNGPLVRIAADFSPRFEVHRDDLVAIDISGLGRLLGTPRAIGDALRRTATERGLRAHVAIAGTRM